MCYDLVAQVEQSLDWAVIIRTTLMRKKRHCCELSLAPLPCSDVSAAFRPELPQPVRRVDTLGFQCRTLVLSGTQLTAPAGVAKASVLVESNSPPTRHFARERTVLEKGPNEAAKPVLGDGRAGVAAVVRVS